MWMTCDINVPNNRALVYYTVTRFIHRLEHTEQKNILPTCTNTHDVIFCHYNIQTVPSTIAKIYEKMKTKYTTELFHSRVVNLFMGIFNVT